MSRNVPAAVTAHRDAWNYREARRRGYSPAAALHHVKAERAARECLLYHYQADGWALDLNATRRHLPGLDIPEDAHVRVEIIPDMDAGSPEDNGDCYSPEDVEAWENGLWGYGVVVVEVTDEGGNTLGSAALGAVEVGEHFLGTAEARAWDALADGLLEWALEDAARAQAARCRACGK